VGTALNYHVKAQWHTVEGAYNNWVETRTPPLFGTEPDARVWDLAAELDDPASYPVLDIGAGTGRNSLALARRGHPVDAVEMTQSFAGILHEEAEKQGLGNLRVIPTEVSVAEEYMHEQYGMIFLSEVVSDFRTVEQVRGIFELASRRLAPGGALVFNAFLPKDGHVVSDAARQFAQFAYTSIFTREEIEDAASGLDLYLVSDESVIAYEQANLPTESWPPTSWYENWTSGHDVFETADHDSRPIDMRWLVYRRRG
jgi:precorrin-6B methylase 2